MRSNRDMSIGVITNIKVKILIVTDYFTKLIRRNNLAKTC